MPPLDRAPTPPPGKPIARPERDPIPASVPPPPHVGRSIFEQQKVGAGPIVGVVIIVALMIFGGLYFWGAYLNNRNSANTLPLIPGDSVTGQ